MNRYIESFLEEFENPQNSKVPDKNYIENYKNKLPATLLRFWEKYGFCSFLDGIFSIVDPEEYRGILEEWFSKTSIAQDSNNYHVIARSGYGDLFIWNEIAGRSYEINSMNGWIIENDSDNKMDMEKQLGLFFASKSPCSLDIEDVETDEEIFEAAVEKLGPLTEDEIFGFVPLLVVGGDMVLDNLQKVNIHIHLDLILQFNEPKVITTEDLKRMAFN